MARIDRTRKNRIILSNQHYVAHRLIELKAIGRAIAMVFGQISERLETGPSPTVRCAVALKCVQHRILYFAWSSSARGTQLIQGSGFEVCIFPPNLVRMLRPLGCQPSTLCTLLAVVRLRLLALRRPPALLPHPPQLANMSLALVSLFRLCEAALPLRLFCSQRHTK